MDSIMQEAQPLQEIDMNSQEFSEVSLLYSRFIFAIHTGRLQEKKYRQRIIDFELKYHHERQSR